jgi:hypothetical protein
MDEVVDTVREESANFSSFNNPLRNFDWINSTRLGGQEDS